ncbi:Hsp20/alpha crystallin family protein, partial [Paenibacillus thiaminolyticus]
IVGFYFVMVKLGLKTRSSKRDLQVSVSPNQLKIEGLPENQTFVVQLPVLVKARECRASYKDGILQIKVRKNNDDMDFYNVGIRYE